MEKATSSIVTDVAQALLAARQPGAPAADAAAFATALTTPDQAFQVQDIVLRALQGRSTSRYWKSGGPSREMPLTHAPLPEACVWTSPAQAGTHPFRHRFVEAEVALRLARAVSPSDAATLTHDNAPGLLDAMTVSIEVVDFRWAQAGGAAALLKLADQQVHGALVLSEWKPYQPRDWSKQRLEVRIGDAERKVYTGTHSLLDPAWLLPLWLRHATRNGDSVEAGTVVTTGTWCGLLKAQQGDAVRVAFDGIGEARLQL